MFSITNNISNNISIIILHDIIYIIYTSLFIICMFIFKNKIYLCEKKLQRKENNIKIIYLFILL